MGRGSGDRRYCLDANLSYRVARALDLVEWPMVHVADVEELTSEGLRTGQCDADDPAIASWCAANGRVLVTLDDDFKVRRARGRSLVAQGAEVILIEYDLSGRPSRQHSEITRLLPHWDRELGRTAYGPRLWLQSKARNAPVLTAGRPKPSRRSDKGRR
ncbi:DUF5615 family PIN-like protein [Iamia sp.]|uniref:DUF5615 family PIN-like protein n=1 Tax=Iamia sp. TaxID=2722710 RepID=UPI002C272580|nr:DUF5615 family PIN-like protein [Iamia sp.]HXH58934.1 DUF5615 family PIN-like protein [Iamia sp.]